MVQAFQQSSCICRSIECVDPKKKIFRSSVSIGETFLTLDKIVLLWYCGRAKEVLGPNPEVQEPKEDGAERWLSPGQGRPGERRSF